MFRILSRCFPVLLLVCLLTGCGAGSPTGSSPAASASASASVQTDPAASASLSEEPDAADDADTRQRVEVQGRTVLLQPGSGTGTMELVLEESGTVLLTLRQEEDYSGNLAIAPFSDVLGTDGFLLRNTWDSTPFRQTTYYALDETGLQPVAESFGFGEEEDTSLDLDGDGIPELVTCNIYGGDGHASVLVFRKEDGEIQRGSIDLDALDMPGFNDWGVNATSEYFDGVRQVFQVVYSVESQEESGLVEFSDLSPFVFHPWPEESAEAADLP